MSKQSQTAPKKRVTRTRTALCKALLSLLEEKSFENITVREVTARAAIGYATFFRWYTDKEELLHDLAAQEISNLLTMTLPILYAENSLASTKALCRYIQDHRVLWTALLTGGAAATLKEEYLIQALKLAEERSDPEAWVPDDLAVTFTITASVEILSWWLKQDSNIPIDEIALYLNRLAIAPIFSPDYRF